MKYILPVNTSSPYVHLLSNKGSNKDSNSEVNQISKFHQDVVLPLASLHHFESNETDNDDGDIEHMNMEVPKIEEQPKADDSSPKISNHNKEELK